MKTDLTTIPSIGKKCALYLNNIGITSVEDLIGADAEELYLKDTQHKGFQDDRCLLYQYRLAIYYANTKNHHSEKLKWWFWKDSIK